MNNLVLAATRKMVAAVATGPIVLGDKEDPGKTKALNDGHVVDMAELGAEESGADTLYEVKNPTPLKKLYSAGLGSRQHGGCPATKGSTHGFGSTLEQYTVMTCGTRKRGRPQDGPFKHDTGKGYVEFKKGHYHDGIYVKKNNLVLALVETSGGVSPPFLRHVGRLHRRTRTPGAVDRTHYGSVRMSPTSYFVHHTQQLSKAAVVGEGASIRRRIDVLKQKACKAVAADAAASWGHTA